MSRNDRDLQELLQPMDYPPERWSYDAEIALNDALKYAAFSPFEKLVLKLTTSILKRKQK